MSVVVVFRQPERIVLAADSICKRVNNRSVETTHVEPGRKIRTGESVATSGLGVQ